MMAMTVVGRIIRSEKIIWGDLTVLYEPQERYICHNGTQKLKEMQIEINICSHLFPEMGHLCDKSNFGRRSCWYKDNLLW